MATIPEEDFLSYDAKFTSRGDWLLLGLIGSVFLQKGLQEHCREVFA